MRALIIHHQGSLCSVCSQVQIVPLKINIENGRIVFSPVTVFVATYTRDLTE